MLESATELMPTPSQPPQPEPPKPRIETRSLHNVELWVREGVAAGRLKKCWNLRIKMVLPQEIESGMETEESFFAPFCECNSFEGPIAYLDDHTKLGFLRRQLNTDPVSCPKNCTMYANRKWGWIKSQLKKITVLYDVMERLLKGYATLPWQTQITLIVAPALVLILWKSPKWVPLIISLAKAIWGK